MRLRIASFNLENLDAAGLAERLPVLRPQLRRLDADVLCLQEVDGQREGQGPRRLLALDRLLEGTDYAGFARASTVSTGRHAGGALGGAGARASSLLPGWPVRERREVREELVAQPPEYRFATAEPAAPGAGQARLRPAAAAGHGGAAGREAAAPRQPAPAGAVGGPRPRAEGGGRVLAHHRRLGRGLLRWRR